MVKQAPSPGMNHCKQWQLSWRTTGIGTVPAGPLPGANHSACLHCAWRPQPLTALQNNSQFLSAAGPVPQGPWHLPVRHNIYLVFQEQFFYSQASYRYCYWQFWPFTPCNSPEFIISLPVCSTL